MRVAAVIQARMTSNRLPGKVLRVMAGQPMLGHLCDSLAHAELIDEIVIATSKEASDDPIAEFARERAILCYRGSLTNVAERMLSAARQAQADTLVRVCGDSPLLDPKLVDGAVRISLDRAPDLVTNVLPRTFPFGQSVEVLTQGALHRAVESMSAPEEREHVTKYMYAHPERFTIETFAATPARADVRLSVDTEQDFQRCEAILATLRCPAWSAGWKACVLAYDQLRGAAQ